MTSKTELILSAILFLIAGGCGGGEQPKTEAPPAAPPATPAAASSPFDGYQVVQVADGGSISGAISVSGAIPKLPTRPINKDPKVCGSGTRESQQLIVNKAGSGLKNAVVIVEGVKRGKNLPKDAQNVQIDQKGCEYIPHVQVIPAKADLAIVNSDPTLHNIHLYQNDDSLFNIAQPVQNQVNKYKLAKTGMVFAQCDVHGWMQSHMAVVDNPYYAVTDENGKFTIADLPAGTYKVKVWHEYLGEKTQDVNVAAKTDAALNLDLKDLLAAKKPAAPITSVPVPGATPAPGGAAAPAKSAGGAALAGKGGEVTVQMIADGTTFKYEPSNLTIKVGTTVKWINNSDNRHTATDDPKFEKKSGEALVPAGVDPWTSPFLPNGESFTRTFTVPGTYRYFCRNHEQFGMVGNITVVP